MDGFLTYEKEGVITKDFMEDFENLVNKIYRSSHLQTSQEEFLGFCTEKLCVRIKFFDPSRSGIGNFVFNIILNEARRLRSKEKHESPAELETLCHYHESPVDETRLLARRIFSMAKRAYNLGIYIDQAQLLAQYQARVESPIVKTFCWLSHEGLL